MSQGARSANGSNPPRRIVVRVTRPQGSRHVNLTHPLGPVPPLPPSVQVVSPSLVRVYGGRANQGGVHPHPNARTGAPQPPVIGPPLNRRPTTSNNYNNPQQGPRPPANPRRNQHTPPANPASPAAHNNQNALRLNLSGPQNSSNSGNSSNQNGQATSTRATTRGRANVRRAARQGEEQAAQNEGRRPQNGAGHSQNGEPSQQPDGRRLGMRPQPVPLNSPSDLFVSPPANWLFHPSDVGASGQDLRPTEPTPNVSDLDIPPRNTVQHRTELAPGYTFPAPAAPREESNHHPAQISSRRLEAFIDAAIPYFPPYIPPHNSIPTPWDNISSNNDLNDSVQDWLPRSQSRSAAAIRPAPIFPVPIISAVHPAPIQLAPTQPTTSARAITQPTPARTNPVRPALVRSGAIRFASTRPTTTQTAIPRPTRTQPTASTSSQPQRNASANANVDCTICLDPPDEFPALRPTSHCTHRSTVCAPCLEQHISHAVLTGGSTTVVCPEVGCGETLEYSDVIRAAKNDKTCLERYEALLLRRMLQAEPNFVWCKSTTCTWGQLHESGAAAPIVICQACHARSCFTHDVPWHTGQTCAQYDSQQAGHANEVQDNLASEAYIRKHAKPCPNPECRRNIEKNHGCDHMTCRRPAGCGHQFCWLCLADYIPIMTEGNHRHASSCRHYAPITGPASRLHAVLAPQTPPAPPILPNIIRVPTPPIYSVLTQARAFRVLARRTPTPHPYGVDVAPRPAPTVQPTIPVPTPALAQVPALAPAPARAHPVSWRGWFMGAISSAL